MAAAAFAAAIWTATSRLSASNRRLRAEPTVVTFTIKTRQTCTLAAAAIAVLNLSRTSAVNSTNEIGNPTTRGTKTLSASGVGLGVGVGGVVVSAYVAGRMRIGEVRR
jgi:hypothetical protein